jgi:hypothetical protein
MVSRYTCKERARANGDIATTSPNTWLTGLPATTEKGWRLSALELERALAIAVRHVLSDRAGLLEALEKSEINSPDVRATLESVSSLLRCLEKQVDAAECVNEVMSGRSCVVTASR